MPVAPLVWVMPTQLIVQSVRTHPSCCHPPVAESCGPKVDECATDADCKGAERWDGSLRLGGWPGGWHSRMPTPVGHAGWGACQRRSQSRWGLQSADPLVALPLWPLCTAKPSLPCPPACLLPLHLPQVRGGGKPEQRHRLQVLPVPEAGVWHGPQAEVNAAAAPAAALPRPCCLADGGTAAMPSACWQRYITMLRFISMPLTTHLPPCPAAPACSEETVHPRIARKLLVKPDREWRHLPAGCLPLPAACPCLPPATVWQLACQQGTGQCTPRMCRLGRCARLTRSRAPPVHPMRCLQAAPRALRVVTLRGRSAVPLATSAASARAPPTPAASSSAPPTSSAPAPPARTAPAEHWGAQARRCRAAGGHSALARHKLSIVETHCPSIHWQLLALATTVPLVAT